MFGNKVRVQVATLAVALMGSATALGQTVVQTLDSVKVHSDTAVLNMNFDDPLEPEFTNSNINGSNYRACKHTGFGLYCLDGDLVRRTPNIENPVTTFTAIDCNDPGLDLDTNKGTPCTAMTVDLTATVWIGGKNKGKSHSLFKAEPNPDPGSACPSGVSVQGNTYCATEVATGRPLLVDLMSVDGDSAKTFFHGAGILGLEERKTAVFFKSIGGVPFVVASGKSDWGLIGNEQLISVTAFQTEDSFGEIAFSYVLATTTKDRVLAKRADGTGPAIPVFDIAANRGPSPPAACPPGDVQYGIRSSGKTGAIYLTDKQYCSVNALQANAQPDGSLAANSLTVADTLYTIDTVGSEGIHAPVAPTVAPGIAIDLDDCSFDQNGNPIVCTLVVDAQGNPAATLSGVQLASLQSGLTLYQVKNIPDCRYVPQVCVDLLDEITSIAGLQPDVVWDPDGEGPRGQLLNLTKLLPSEITDQFLLGEPLPDLWLPRQYRGQKSNGFVFEAFFGVTEDGVIFRDTFEGVFNVAALAGSSLGCEPVVPGTLPSPTSVSALLAWDVLNTVSEEFPTFDDPFLPPHPGGTDEHVSTIINAGCGSSKSIDIRWSLKPYNLEVTPCTYNPNANDVWVSDGVCATGVAGAEVIDDAVFAKLLLGLFDDFKLTLDQLACADADGAGSPPIASCSTLQANWFNAKDKLDKCWDATQKPKQSAGSQNCTSFESQLNGLESNLNAVTVPAPPLDPANRIGELKSRLKVIRHIYVDRFTPSIPTEGFVEPQP